MTLAPGMFRRYIFRTPEWVEKAGLQDRVVTDEVVIARVRAWYAGSTIESWERQLIHDNEWAPSEERTVLLFADAT